MEIVGTAFGLSIHLGARGTPLGRVKPIGDDLEFGESVLAVAWLAECGSGIVLSHLLAVHIDLELPAVIAADRRVAAHVVDSYTRNHQREIHPVTSVQRNIMHLLGRHISRYSRRSRVDGLDVLHDIYRRADVRGAKLDVDDRRLPDQKL